MDSFTTLISYLQNSHPIIDAQGHSMLTSFCPSPDVQPVLERFKAIYCPEYPISENEYIMSCQEILIILFRSQTDGQNDFLYTLIDVVELAVITFITKVFPTIIAGRTNDLVSSLPGSATMTLSLLESIDAFIFKHDADYIVQFRMAAIYQLLRDRQDILLYFALNYNPFGAPNAPDKSILDDPGVDYAVRQPGILSRERTTDPALQNVLQPGNLLSSSLFSLSAGHDSAIISQQQDLSIASNPHDEMAESTTLQNVLGAHTGNDHLLPLGPYSTHGHPTDNLIMENQNQSAEGELWEILSGFNDLDRSFLSPPGLVNTPPPSEEPGKETKSLPGLEINGTLETKTAECQESSVHSFNLVERTRNESDLVLATPSESLNEYFISSAPSPSAILKDISFRYIFASGEKKIRTTRRTSLLGSNPPRARSASSKNVSSDQTSVLPPPPTRPTKYIPTEGEDNRDAVVDERAVAMKDAHASKDIHLEKIGLGQRRPDTLVKTRKTRAATFDCSSGGKENQVI